MLNARFSVPTNNEGNGSTTSVISLSLEWRLEELAQIDVELDGPERKAALCALLEQETQLIASIGRHKLDASKENKEKSIERFLSKVCIGLCLVVIFGV